MKANQQGRADIEMKQLIQPGQMEATKIPYWLL